MRALWRETAIARSHSARWRAARPARRHTTSVATSVSRRQRHAKPAHAARSRPSARSTACGRPCAPRPYAPARYALVATTLHRQHAPNGTGGAGAAGLPAGAAMHCAERSATWTTSAAAHAKGAVCVTTRRKSVRPSRASTEHCHARHRAPTTAQSTLSASSHTSALRELLLPLPEGHATAAARMAAATAALHARSSVARGAVILGSFSFPDVWRERNERLCGGRETSGCARVL